LAWPTPGPVTSVFGWRWGRPHQGIDIGAPSGQTIVASGSGTVFFAGWMGGYGNLILIDHGNGIVTAYAHQTHFAVNQGASVGRGQAIGYVGSTGNSTGPHLHFEVRRNGVAVDPMPYLR
jgi:murein DD-endopeptidase MepM/ murein hydrolase activator NlpD